MRDFLRRAVHHAVVPAMLAAFYVAAHWHSVAAGNFSIAWREGDVVRVGNPYTAPFLPIFYKTDPASAEDVATDASASGISANADDADMTETVVP